ncbi:hypothetical protein ILUMI_11151 [Ignelater luminosus]|uniref:Uncharacterized protein n=1 Tax=Ignelater luminosus TaxID=2038154 RepID=A0A8K0D1Y5_IGNLU|nr:hypothetical protein ILUMI_11151 [Ignelater luminosus]
MKISIPGNWDTLKRQPQLSTCGKQTATFRFVGIWTAKLYYNTAATDWVVSNPRKTLTMYEVPKLAAVALPQAFKLQNIQSGFSNAGIWPFNSNIFSDNDYLCSAVTDRAMLNMENTSFGQNPSTSTTTMPDTDYGVVEQNPSTSPMNMSDADNAPIENASILSHNISVGSSENEDENVFIADESESEEFDEDDIISLDKNFKTEDFVVVKFDTKKDTYHYIGRIINIDNSIATIKFMLLTKVKNTFMYPDIEDIDNVPIDDIKRKLPTPTISTKFKQGTTKNTFDKLL